MLERALDVGPAKGSKHPYRRFHLPTFRELGVGERSTVARVPGPRRHRGHAA